METKTMRRLMARAEALKCYRVSGFLRDGNLKAANDEMHAVMDTRSDAASERLCVSIALAYNRTNRRAAK